MRPDRASSNRLYARLRDLLDRPGDTKQQLRFDDNFVVGTAQGKREENQDRALVVRLSSESRSKLIAVVCDGMGGMVDGAWCATEAAARFVISLIQAPSVDVGAVDAAIRDADAAIFKRYRGDGGSTLVAYAQSEGSPGLIAHVGDSRAYEWDGERRLRLLTRDDTIAALASDAADAAGRALDNRLVQFVGFGPEIRPHVVAASSERPRSLLLTTDGAHGPANGLLPEIVGHSPGSWQLVERLIALSLWVGGRDNATVLAFPLPEFRSNPAAGRGRERLPIIEIATPKTRVELWDDAPGEKKKGVTGGGKVSLKQPRKTEQMDLHEAERARAPRRLAPLVIELNDEEESRQESDASSAASTDANEMESPDGKDGKDGADRQ